MIVQTMTIQGDEISSNGLDAMLLLININKLANRLTEPRLIILNTSTTVLAKNG